MMSDEQKTIDSDGALRITFADLVDSKTPDTTFLTPCELKWMNKNRTDLTVLSELWGNTQSSSRSRYSAYFASYKSMFPLVDTTFALLAHMLSSKVESIGISTTSILQLLSQRRLKTVGSEQEMALTDFFGECQKRITTLSSSLLGLDTGTAQSSRLFACFIVGFKAMRIIVDKRSQDAERLVYRLLRRIANSLPSPIQFTEPILLL